MEKGEIINLLKRYSDGKCDEAEKARVETWYVNQQSLNVPHLTEAVLNADLAAIEKRLPQKHRKILSMPWYYSTVAAALLIIASGTFLYITKDPAYNQAQRLNSKSIKPGGNHAILTLADGQVILLDTAKKGTLISQSGLKVEKAENGELVFSMPATAKGTVNAKTYNTLETPKGGQYQLNLPDGTKIWLNAMSSIRFPSVFAAHERKVELTGEAYFEVAHNAAKPFKVASNTQQVEVLGTHFDVKTYADEPYAETTLMQGSVSVSSLNGGSALLKPGQQSKTDKSNIRVNQADTEAVIAWKNGYFIFKNEDIESIMRKLSRWYNIDVVFEGDFKDKRFEGAISRFNDISEILRKFELTESIHFKIEGRRVIVMK